MINKNLLYFLVPCALRVAIKIIRKTYKSEKGSWHFSDIKSIANEVELLQTVDHVLIIRLEPRGGE